MNKIIVAALVSLLAFPATAQVTSYMHVDPVTGKKVPIQVDDSGNFPLPVTGGGGGGGGAVTVADGADVAEGATGATAWTGTGSGSLISIDKYIAAKVEAVRALLAGTGSISALTATTTAAPTYTTGTNNPQSTDVHGSTRVINMDSTGTPIDPNASVAITAASLPLPAGAATSALQAGLTSAGMLRPPSAASGKLVQADVSLTTATNTTILAADANLIAIEIQCNGGPVKISAVGATLTSSAQGTGPSGTILPTANTLYTPSEASQLAYTAYQSTGSAVVCTVSKWDQ